MNAIFKKLNYKTQDTILCLNAPSSFEKELDDMKPSATIATNIADVKTVGFAIVFATKQQEVDAAVITLLPKLESDAVLWFCYPKGSSKKYKCDFNRDNGWQALGDGGFEPVRQVAIDEDWSALRFRKAEHIKTLTRRQSHVLSDAVKSRLAGKKQ